jgi:hypothetical protein
MTEKKFIRTLSCLCVVLMACGTAFAQQGKLRSGPYSGQVKPMISSDIPDVAPIYTNLVQDTTAACTPNCLYSTANGYFVLGPNNCFAPGATQWISFPFVATRTASVRQVKLSVTDSGFCVAGSTKFTVAIYSDDAACGGIPGTQIGNSVVATAPAAPCLTATANFSTAGVSVTAGTTYWLVATTSTAASQMSTTAIWWMANSAYAPYNLNDGNGWVAFPDGAPGGFSVN